MANGGLNVVFPDYSIALPRVMGNSLPKLPLGHGLSIAIDERTGRTRASEYGRYDSYGTAKRV